MPVTTRLSCDIIRILTGLWYPAVLNRVENQPCSERSMLSMTVLYFTVPGCIGMAFMAQRLQHEDMDADRYSDQHQQ